MKLSCCSEMPCKQELPKTAALTNVVASARDPVPRVAEVAVRRWTQGLPSCCTTRSHRMQRPIRRARGKWSWYTPQLSPLVDDILLVREIPDGDGASELRAAPWPQHQAGALIIGVFTKRRPRTRHFALQGQSFFAFTVPHTHTCQIGVWRRLGDVVVAGYRSVDASAPCRLRLLGSAGESLAPGKSGQRVGPLADLYCQRPFDRRAWVYWDCFWVPVGPDVLAQRYGHVPTHFQPQVSHGILASTERTTEEVVDPFGLLARVPANRRRTPELAQAPAGKDAHAAVSKAEAFASIYREAVWPGRFSASGPGSDPFHPMVRIALSALDMAVDALDITSILDAACGDAGWITSNFLSRRPGIQYVGVDIVAHIVEDNRKRYPSLRFLTLDLGHPSNDEPLPPVDLVFSKETLNHMYVQDAVLALQRFQTTRARYLLTNITRGAPNYVGALKGGHQNYVQYDYSLPPFNLKKLGRLMHCNLDDWTEYALFALQPDS